MGESGNAASLHTALKVVQALERRIDVDFDTRLLYCKGVTGSMIVEIEDEHGRDNQTVLPNISRDINNSSEPFLGLQLP
ncbi:CONSTITUTIVE ACTIVE DEFENSE 1, necrotic spotted lesion 2, constitutively activated cell death 1 [Hibiscus trionum]|uniref:CONSTITUTIVE ACTIVE DEFENSE 1, necrotic spotted lesion 2, constitutively activated cell death 1 n=1 Tax=Hibiscus trionum TaxID=183268 RepID=A0A9W7J5T9_HIBTR|nr:CONSTITUTIVE ACTIVE DEFENSE 1, necrotic spotted lesion 2, constitutively activated cell death 1 [Hibiscus trionum]